jgi:aspartate racemase
MKKIGMVGGTAWPSTVHYYSLICKQSEAAYGVTPEFSIESLDLRHAMSLFGTDGDEASWATFDAYYVAALQRLERCGAEIAFLAAATPHHRFEAITRYAPMPVVSIVPAVAEAVVRGGFESALLLGTHVTMQSKPMRDEFARAGLLLALPGNDDREHIAALIERIQHGDTEDAATEIAAIAAGRACILGCTELALAFPNELARAVITRNGAPFFNSLAIHAKAVLHHAVDSAQLAPR